MSFASATRQEMPPAGGYRPIFYKRNPAKTYFTGYGMIAGYLGMTAGALYLYSLNRKQVVVDEVERRSANFAVLPLLTAERDREYLKQLRRNRDEEAQLMKNVEGWEVGTWFGEPIYRNVPKDHLVEPFIADYFVHAPYSEFVKVAHMKFWT